jgi:uncharacterized protein YgbK (DUF1537 family)
VRLAIVADDLTGALDVSAPIAARGLRVVVATGPGATAQAINTGAEVICVNTASREIAADAARDAVSTVSRMLAAVRPEVALKKVDSRLKGHVALETRAMMAAFGKVRAIVAPAVPGQGRMVTAGHVRGHGVDQPIPVAAAFAGIAHSIPDTPDNAALTAIARDIPKEALLVGASGLGVGLAQRLARRAAVAAPRLPGPLLVAVGSHDPITLQQVEIALAGGAFTHIISRDGALGSVLGGPTLVQAVVSRDGSFGAAMARFGKSIADLLRDRGFGTVLLTGGETAQSVLGELGVTCLEVLGEVLPGIPVTRSALGERDLTILTKSGGFGTPEDILRLAEIAQEAAPVADRAYAGERR